MWLAGHIKLFYKIQISPLVIFCFTLYVMHILIIRVVMEGCLRAVLVVMEGCLRAVLVVMEGCLRGCSCCYGGMFKGCS